MPGYYPYYHIERPQFFFLSLYILRKNDKWKLLSHINLDSFFYFLEIVGYMIGFIYNIISATIGTVAIIVAIVTLLEGRKRTKLMETMIKALPYTTRKKRTKTKSNEKQSTGKTLSQARSDDIKRMRLELDKEKLQWQKNKDIAKGIAWVIDRLDSDEDE